MTAAVDAPGRAAAAAPSLGHCHHRILHREKSSEREKNLWLRDKNVRTTVNVLVEEREELVA
jgi:hypothetical protein